MKSISSKLSEAILLTVVYIAGVIFFRFLIVLGSNMPMNNTLPPLILNLVIAFVGTIIGACMAFMEFKIFPRLARLSKLQYMAMRFIITITTITLGITIVHLLLVMLYLGKPFSEAFATTIQFLTTGVFWAAFIYLMVFSIILNVFKVVHYHVGPGTLINFVMGKYRIPQEEDRVFMFIDLKSSTSIAEQLGHVKYSRFLTTFFNDLTDSIAEYEAEVYQYVGDEVVLTWRTDQGKKDLKCIRLFFAFKSRLLQNQKLYLDKFGVFPEFKASIHTGLVSVSETQGMKRELVYRGDVLNTCARILELCSRLKKELLFSSDVAQWLNDNPEYTIQHLEEIMLRGKGESTSVFELSLSSRA
ncbi:MAG TPA: adenylate/guanylate cyclase domain-containing protein [Ohtaekwangia sp.]|uniref:adenylate/guanylate cyclase domain-containing protein n=1 Tax=Ohtaekwangia sp. TaxID=2066019 RepID=UPI002F952BC0